MAVQDPEHVLAITQGHGHCQKTEEDTTKGARAEEDQDHGVPGARGVIREVAAHQDVEVGVNRGEVSRGRRLRTGRRTEVWWYTV